jgi:hypothetical protein
MSSRSRRPSLLGPEEQLHLDPTLFPPSLMPTSPGLDPAAAPLDLWSPIPQRDPGLRMPFLDSVPFGDTLRGTVNDWLRDPYGLNQPQPAWALPTGDDGPRFDDPRDCQVTADPAACRDAHSPTMFTTPKIPIPGT